MILMKFVRVKSLVFLLSLAVSFVSFAAEPVVEDNHAGRHAADWLSFRGAGAKGVADGHELPAAWNADPDKGEVKGVLWRVEVPGWGTQVQWWSAIRC